MRIKDHRTEDREYKPKCEDQAAKNDEFGK